MEKLRPGDPEHIGPYEVIARLGAGGMGVVFLGTKGADRVAIKVVRSTFLDDPSLKTRFIREIETLQKVESPYVAKFLDSSVDGEISWHAVEFVNGPTLRELVDSNGPMAELDWAKFAGQLRQALESIHRLGIIHRDIKPSNIIMSEAGPKLIDFGISQDTEATSITTTGMVAGSPAWLSPEQLTGDTLTPASDLYSAGSVLTFAASGRSPWGQETTMSVPVVYQKILSGDFNLSALSPRQREVVEGLCNSDPARRSFLGEPLEVATAPVVEPLEENKGLKENSGSPPMKRRLLWGAVSLALSASLGAWAIDQSGLFGSNQAVVYFEGPESQVILKLDSRDVRDARAARLYYDSAVSWGDCESPAWFTRPFFGATSWTLSCGRPPTATPGDRFAVLKVDVDGENLFASVPLADFLESSPLNPVELDFAETAPQSLVTWGNTSAGTNTDSVGASSLQKIQAAEQQFIDSGKCENVLALFAEAEAILIDYKDQSAQLSSRVGGRLYTIAEDIREISRELPDGSALRASINNAVGYLGGWGSANYILLAMEPSLKDVRDSCR